ncbi:hypothetical protein CFC35_20655 [Streptomyces sp. FBKL.4005]|uniref:hypothetical protein n=1 Tax=Streptomyces sp. FBKL.4005 TaxID=2015515 RepID=UPI000B963029|nr:hypothetical protein [Streptomyces sp. FBKL.4005]OYP16616.1 hypothetical protein CFC35_20655 [Streptomyces sp. FBKL.4005]
MSSTEGIPTPQNDPIFVIGASGRLPLRTISALEMRHTEIQGHLHKWRALLGDRLHTATKGQLPHPSRRVKGEYDARMAATSATAARALGHRHARRLTESLTEFPRLHVSRMTKRHARQAERDILEWQCTLLDGRPSGLALIHTSRGVLWYRLTAEGPDVEPLAPDSAVWQALPASPAEVELLLTPAKLAAYAAYQHGCYPHRRCRPAWLPPELPWADRYITLDITA